MTNVTVIGDISGPGSRRRAQLGIGGGSCRTGGCVPQLRRRLRAPQSRWTLFTGV